MLATTAALAAAPSLPTGREDAVFTDVFGLTIVAWPPAAGWAFIAAAAVLLAVGAWRARGSERYVPALAAGAARLLLGVLLAGLLLTFARLWLGGDDGPPREALLAAMPWLLTSVGAILALALLLAWSGARTPASGLGALAVGLALAAAAQALAPETAFLLAWPVLLGALLAAVAPRPGTLSTAVAVGFGALGLGWLAGFLHQFVLSLGLLYPEALASGALLIPLVLHPLLGRVQAAARRTPGLT